MDIHIFLGDGMGADDDRQSVGCFDEGLELQGARAQMMMPIFFISVLL